VICALLVPGMAVRRSVYAVLAAAALLAAAGCGGKKPEAPKPAPAAPAGSGLRGLVPEPMPEKPAIRLTDTAGHTFDLVSRTRGKLTYLYFGYTRCPDACPATMDEIAYALKRQPASVRRRVAVVFVTVDPRHDTGPVLRRWLNHFSRSFVGLIGTELQIEHAEAQAGVPYVPASKGKATYVRHSSLVFPYSPDGRAHVVYAQGFKPDDYAHDLPLLLRY
jgi:protein SCO1